MHNNMPEVGRAYRKAYREGLRRRQLKIDEMERVLEEHECIDIRTCPCFTYKEELARLKGKIIEF